ncbi:MAG: EamA family transporter [Chloroflexi bacterium]|nr:EamA family transporter [Chloroflexota bacterium]
MSYLVLALLTMVFLGLHYFLAKVISPHISGPVIAFAGALVYLPGLYLYIYFTKLPIIPAQPIYWWYAILIAVPMTVGAITLYMAIQKGPLSIVMPIYALNAMVVALLGILILHEPVSVPKVIGLVLAFAAIILLSR